MFNLVNGVYLNDSINLRTFKKTVPFMGIRFCRDYQCLDFCLTNLSKPIRRYLMQNINANDHTLQAYIMAAKRQNEKEYQSNPSVYQGIIDEKKHFMKTIIRAR